MPTTPAAAEVEYATADCATDAERLTALASLVARANDCEHHEEGVTLLRKHPHIAVEALGVTEAQVAEWASAQADGAAKLAAYAESVRKDNHHPIDNPYTLADAVEAMRAESPTVAKDLGLTVEQVEEWCRAQRA